MEDEATAAKNQLKWYLMCSRTIVNPKYNGEPALQSRRHKAGYYIVIEGKFGGY